ncbi:MAG: hypothetical protein AB8G23_03975 [Myxococcota bacterium]
MARIDGVEDQDANLIQRFVFRTAAKKLGAVPAPLRIMAKSRNTMFAAGGFEMGIERAQSVPASLKTLACLKTASMIGCLF